ncbi:hypothetical protein HYW60_03670 [Candidatus Kaiserbacteria bacterium]|nr:hypothetical protein [Candidatus Kaiserbacteria bacterium]
MWSRNQRQTATRLFLKRLGLLALAALALFAASGVWGVFQKERESASRKAEAELERADLLARQQQLSADIEMLESDRGLEETLREQYGFAERGEGLIVIVERPTSAPIHATSTLREWFRKTFWRW